MLLIYTLSLFAFANTNTNNSLLSNSNESMTQENIGVWTFEIISSSGSSDNIAINLEEATRQEMLPLLQSNSNLNLITPENMTINGQIPSGNRILDMSKALNLDYVVTGKLVISTQSNLVLKLYHVQTGVLLQQQSIAVADADDLLYEISPLLRDLLTPVMTKEIEKDAPEIVASFSASPSENTILFVDGKVTCQQLPCSAKIRQGVHNIQFHNPLYEIWTKDQYIYPDSQISAELMSSFGYVTVDSQPKGIQIQIDGVAMGQTPLTQHKLSPGEHEVSVLDPCYTSKPTNFTIANSQEERIQLYGVPRTAGLDVYLENPTQEAKVFIDDKYLDKTPLSRSIPVCSKKIRVEGKHGIFEQDLNLRESEVQKLEVKLRKPQKKKKGKNKSLDKVSDDKDYFSSGDFKFKTKRFNPTHITWSTYTVQYGFETQELSIGIIGGQFKSGWNQSFLSPILPGVRGQVVDYSIGSTRNHYLFPMGLGYALDIELGLLQPYYQWQWLSVPNLRNIQQADDLLTETTFTPNRHKVGLDFILNKEPFKDISRSKQKVGGTFQANVSYLVCMDEEDTSCNEDIYAGVSIFLQAGRWPLLK